MRAAGQKKAPAPASSAVASAAPLSADQAFRLAFGGPAPFERTARIPDYDNEQQLTYRPAKLVPLEGGLVALVSTATNASDCHACSGALAVHYFKRDAAGAWAVAGSWTELTSGNGFGQPPNWTARTDLGGSGHWLQIDAGWTGQGYTCAFSDLVELMPERPVMRGENIPTHFDNGGAALEESQIVRQQGTIGSGPKSGWVRVSFSGTTTGTVDYEPVGGSLVRRSPNLVNDC